MNLACVAVLGALAIGAGADFKTATPRPADFDAYWENAIAALDREVPEDARCEHDPALDTAAFTCYRVSFATYGKNRRVYGFLSVPKAGKAPFPVRITVPGAGRGAFVPFKQTGCIGLVMNVHDYAPKANRAEQEAAYQDENARWGAPYGVKWYYHSGIQKSREDYFYYGAILGINRAVNWLARRKDVDLGDFTYRGQSQGGAFGIYLAALNPHITVATISEPAITDTLAYKVGRQSGWPRIVEEQPDKSPANIAAIEERMRYFDAVNFVPRIKCPTRWLAGWEDKLCPAECVHAGYNRLNGANDKRIVDGEFLGHGVPNDVYQKYEKLLTASWEPIPGILVGDDPVDRLAAKEFAKYYEKMSGMRLTVAKEAHGTGPFVRIGRSFAKGLEFDAKFDSYRIRSEKKNGHWSLLLAGGNARSTMYAVYEFFKTQGCRWFWDGDVVPKTGVVDLSGRDVYEVSAFEWRATRYFAHRGLRRFSAEMWGPGDWKREIDWCLKNRLNLFFFRLGMDDLFQKAFPEFCKYPDASKPLPGQQEGYDNRSLFWSLEYRGKLRKKFTEYAYARGLMIPPDFGTITHWYTRTPEDFLRGAKPDFLPEPSRGYAAHDSGKVWDVRQDKWMDAYWKITEAEIANYGRTPGPLHTIGFSERNLFDSRADNIRMKRETTKRMFDRALKAYPGATILFAGWDFYSTWRPEEVREYLKTLDPKHVVILDYEANAYKPQNRHGCMTDFTKWDIVGKFPYTFGTFFYESGTPIHTDYELTARRRRLVKDDPMCKGNVLWPEASHVDILEQRDFTDNAWRFTDTTTDAMIDAFCADRYGKQAKALAAIWKKVVPLSTKCAGKQGRWRANYADLVVNSLGRDWPLENADDGDSATVGLEKFAAAPEIFRKLADVEWKDAFVRRDTIDLARTVADRLILELACEAQTAYLSWRDKKGATPAEALAKADLAIAFVELMKDVLALHSDFSLNETLAATDAIEEIRLPNFDEVLVQNSVNDYCASHQYEPAAYLYPRQYAAWRAEMARRFADASPGAKMTGVDVAALLKKFWKKPLTEMRPTLLRTPENYRRTMLALAKAADGLFCNAAKKSGLPVGRKVNLVVKKGAPLVLSEPLLVGSGSTIFLEDGAEIVAASGKFLGKNDALVQILGATNVVIRGKGTLRMRKDDYCRPPYKVSEHRHCLAIRGSADVLVEDITCRDAGGDGVLLSDYGRGRTNSRITLRRVTCDSGHRQGVSVISAEDLLIEDCDFVNTAGTAPEAGIDFEPNYPVDRLVRCVVRNTRFAGNRGAGVDVSFHNLNETTLPVDIRFENCRIADNGYAAVVIARNKFNESPKGIVRFDNCTLIGGRSCGVELFRKVGDGFRVEFNHCRIENVGPNGRADVTFVSRDWSDDPPDNIAFNDLSVVQPKAREWFQNIAPGLGPSAVRDITGTVTVKSPNGERKIVLDEAWRRANFRDPPQQPPARWTARGQPDVVAFDSCPGKSVRLPAFAHSGEARMVFYADRAKKVNFVGQRYWWPGKKPDHEIRPIEITSLDGMYSTSVPIVPFEPTAFSVEVPKAGLYHLHVYCYRNKFILNEADVPVAIWLRQGPQRIFCLEQGLKMFLRPTAGEMAVLASCKDESINFRLSSADGLTLWSAAPHDWTSFVTNVSAGAGLWTLDFGCPNASAFPTGYSTIIDVTGTPGFLFLSGEKTWMVK